MATIAWRQRLAIPVVALGTQFFYDGGTLHLWPGTAIALLFTFVLWEGNVWILRAARRRFPRPDQIGRRFLVQIPAHLAYTLLAGLLVKLALVLAVPEIVCNMPSVGQSFLLNMVPTALVVLVYETIYFFEQWRHNLTRAEALARTAAQSELEALRQQLDPHFLFNSLNTLAALIDDANPAAAQQYLSQLADVYRYVLLAKDRQTVPLHEELAFVEAYVALNKVRFRENLIVNNTIPAAAYPRHVAPLSVQTLVENALKHNVVSREYPLVLHLEGRGPDEIRVRNPVRRKATLVPGTHTGLRNLISRYELLTAAPVEVSTGEGEFRVCLPLL